MVRNTRSNKLALVVIPLALCLLLLLWGLALAQEDGQTAEPTITETYRVAINDVGDAQIEDTIKYSEQDYEDMKKVITDNPTFLTRLYTTERDIAEVLNFDTEMDDANRQVVITFDTPGYSYNMKDSWVIYGITNKPKKESGRTIEFEEQTDINNEFSLFTDQTLKTRTVYELPKKARNARYNKEEKQVEYVMPEARASLGFWSQNRTLLSVIFGILALLFAGLMAFVITRKTIEAPAPAHRVTPTTPPPSTVMEAVPEKRETGVCEKCGRKIKHGKKFCTHCGAPV
ncbi:MAG: zinc ribbon domain-containing protein [Actinobacteria bacterium]|nr:zinc ribbon domain-containing protein [Actinomycetota bacterium]